jgi:hypothetical protein
MAKPFSRPLRISMGITAAKEMPEDVAKNLLCDEVHSTLLAMGVPAAKVNGCDAELLAEIHRALKMPEKQAFQHMVYVSKKSLLKLGV